MLVHGPTVSLCLVKPVLHFFSFLRANFCYFSFFCWLVWAQIHPKTSFGVFTLDLIFLGFFFAEEGMLDLIANLQGRRMEEQRAVLNGQETESARFTKLYLVIMSSSISKLFLMLFFLNQF